MLLRFRLLRIGKLIGPLGLTTWSNMIQQDNLSRKRERREKKLFFHKNSSVCLRMRHETANYISTMCAKHQGDRKRGKIVRRHRFFLMLWIHRSAHLVSIGSQVKVHLDKVKQPLLMYNVRLSYITSFYIQLIVSFAFFYVFIIIYFLWCLDFTFSFLGKSYS